LLRAIPDWPRGRLRFTVESMLQSRNFIEIDITDPRLTKALELRDLAMDFRERAEEISLVKCVDLMLQGAVELERLAEDLERMSDSNYVMFPVAGHA
jgi:hypothetical protein